MTIEVGTTEPAASTATLSPAAIAFLDAVRKGEGGAPLLKKILGEAKLSAEQQALVDLLLETQNQADEATGEVIEDDRSPEDCRQELSNLREGNDTLASALGACPICWGGDRGCEVCRGRGRPGYRPPDPALFNELVVPAIQRVRHSGQRLQQNGTSRTGRARV